MKYYYIGCVSWGWFYPYHYTPFITDLIDLFETDLSYDYGKGSFRVLVSRGIPFQQLNSKYIKIDNIFEIDLHYFFNFNWKHWQPFMPFEQLLAVLPAASKSALPSTFHDLMEDKDSPIIDFYPTDFNTDLNGKTQEWESVVLIPFINENRLRNCQLILNDI